MRDELWELLIRADANALYFGRLLERRTQLQQGLAIAAAIISSSSVLLSLSTVMPEAAPLVSAVGAVCAVLATHLKTPEPLTRAATEWRLVERAVNTAWHQVERSEELTCEDADALRERFAAATTIYPESPTNQRLVDDMHRRALATHGVAV